MSQARDLITILHQTIDNVPGGSYQDKLNHLSNCNCCERHLVNKPTVFAPWYETPFNYTQNIYPCMCNCRHVARIICRQANVTPPPPPTRANSPISVLDF